MTTTETAYTIEELTAMPGDDLNALARKLYPLQKVAKSPLARWERLVDYIENWNPATSRNQSGELLQWAAKQGCYFFIGFGDFNSDVRVRINLERTQYGEREIFLDETILGNTARAETIAFCAAMLAMAGRLK